MIDERSLVFGSLYFLLFLGRVNDVQSRQLEVRAHYETHPGGASLLHCFTDFSAKLLEL